MAAGGCLSGFFEIGGRGFPSMITPISADYASLITTPSLRRSRQKSKGDRRRRFERTALVHCSSLSLFTYYMRLPCTLSGACFVANYLFIAQESRHADVFDRRRSAAHQKSKGDRRRRLHRNAEVHCSSSLYHYSMRLPCTPSGALTISALRRSRDMQTWWIGGGAETQKSFFCISLVGFVLPPSAAVLLVPIGNPHRTHYQQLASILYVYLEQSWNADSACCADGVGWIRHLGEIFGARMRYNVDSTPLILIFNFLNKMTTSNLRGSWSNGRERRSSALTQFARNAFFSHGFLVHRAPPTIKKHVCMSRYSLRSCCSTEVGRQRPCRPFVKRWASLCRARHPIVIINYSCSLSCRLGGLRARLL